LRDGGGRENHANLGYTNPSVDFAGDDSRATGHVNSVISSPK
jgi:hypothetical protein